MENQSAGSDVAPASAATTVQKILDNALIHFSRKGYGGASVREITEASQVTKPTLYYYFKNKEELFVQLAKHCQGLVYSRLEASTKTSGPIEQRLVDFLHSYVQLCREHEAVIRFVHTMSLAPDPDVPDVGMPEYGRRVSKLVYDMIDAAVASGELPADKAECISFSSFSVMFFAISGLLIGTRTDRDLPMIEQALRCMVNSVSAQLKNQ